MIVIIFLKKQNIETMSENMAGQHKIQNAENGTVFKNHY